MSNDDKCCILQDENIKNMEPEVELISLTYEYLPKYKLRADCNVDYVGYQHSDFSLANRQQPKEEADALTDEQISSIFQYFLLCGLRVSKMTETYEDCNAMRSLIQEQQSHLDLAANIGIRLIETKDQLETRINNLETQLDSSKETILQLRHQLNLKDDLLKVVHAEMENEFDYEDDQLNYSATPAINYEVESPNNVCSWRKVNVKKLEDKVTALEEENANLRNKHTNITETADMMEKKERKLIDDCVGQLTETTNALNRLSGELNKKTVDYMNQHEEITKLLTRKIDMENRIHQLLTDNDNLVTQVRDYQTKHFIMTKELTELRDRYDECLNLLNERQDQVRMYKKQYEKDLLRQQFVSTTASMTRSSLGNESVSGGPASLANEIEEHNRRESLRVDFARTMRIMEQARSIKSINTDQDESSSGFADCEEDDEEGMDTSFYEQSVGGGGNFLLRRSIHEDCVRRRVNNKHHVDSSIITGDGSVLPSSRRIIEDWNSSGYSLLSSTTPMDESMMSTKSGLSFATNVSFGATSTPTSHFKMPEKLQLVKPMEGSQTLRAWQNLATPNLTKALFEDQPKGVCFRGQQLSSINSERSSSSNTSETSPISEKSFVSVKNVTCDINDVDDDDDVTLLDSLSIPLNYSQGHSQGQGQGHQSSCSTICGAANTTICSTISTTTSQLPSVLKYTSSMPNYKRPVSLTAAITRNESVITEALLGDCDTSSTDACSTPINDGNDDKNKNAHQFPTRLRNVLGSSWLQSLVTASGMGPSSNSTVTGISDCSNRGASSSTNYSTKRREKSSTQTSSASSLFTSAYQVQGGPKSSSAGLNLLASQSPLISVVHRVGCLGSTSKSDPFGEPRHTSASVPSASVAAAAAAAASRPPGPDGDICRSASTMLYPPVNEATFNQKDDDGCDFSDCGSVHSSQSDLCQID